MYKYSEILSKSAPMSFNRFRLILPSALSLLLTSALTHSLIISVAVALMIFMMLQLSRNISSRRNSYEMSRHIPEIIDHIISGLQSGLSLPESLTSLSSRGPSIFQPIFAEFSKELMSGQNLEIAIAKVQKTISHRSADQLFESLLYGKSLGGGELVSLLRQLSDFARTELAFRDEIHAKQSSIRNSAHLSAIAPWLLLVLLSTQPATANAYSTGFGVLILLSGLAMTGIAYMWMSRLSKLPEASRIFGENK